MRHDVRLAAMKDLGYKPGRIGALAAIIAMLALLGALALTSPYVRAPELAASGTDARPAAAPGAAPSAAAGPTGESPGYPMECTPVLIDSGAECVFQ